MTDAILVEGLGKRYWKFEEQPLLVKSLIPFRRQKPSALWALRDISLTVPAGETTGIIGRNGSGKTTLLKLLSGVTQPTEGRVLMAGRLAPLIGVGVGFHHEMSGRENVKLNGMLLGLTADEVEERFDDIVAFAELREFIDTPVKFYSSGMFLRLGFAIAIHTEPDIFLVDEILAVGDLAFQGKCFERLAKAQRQGTTIVVVSHNLQAIQALCSHAILLRRGRAEAEGDPASVIARYHDLLSTDDSSDLEAAVPGEELVFAGGATILERELLGPDGPAHYTQRGTELCLRLRIRFETDVESPMVAVQVHSQTGIIVYGKRSIMGIRYRRFHAGEEAEITASFRARVGGGTYRVVSYVLSNDARRVLAWDLGGEYFFVEERPGVTGTADLEGQVTVEGHDLDSITDSMSEADLSGSGTR